MINIFSRRIVMIRKATKTDTDKIMHIWLEASKKAHGFVAADFWEDKFAEVRDVYLPLAETFVFEDKHKVKGFVSVLSDSFIGALFVENGFQRQNIGSKLLAYVRQKRPSLTLSVHAKNQPAINFYQKNGFKIIAQRKDNKTNEDELIMSWAVGCKSGFIKKNHGES